MLERRFGVAHEQLDLAYDIECEGVVRVQLLPAVGIGQRIGIAMVLALQADAECPSRVAGARGGIELDGAACLGLRPPRLGPALPSSSSPG